jgi:hypothetical protein
MVTSLRGSVLEDALVPASHTAFVYAFDGVRFTASARSRRALMERLADYVRRHAGDRLWPQDARRVDQLLDGGAHEEAVELYFAVVGQRWDEEWVVLADPFAS